MTRPWSADQAFFVYCVNNGLIEFFACIFSMSGRKVDELLALCQNDVMLVTDRKGR